MAEQIVEINLRLIKCGSDLVEDGLVLILERMILENTVEERILPLTEEQKAIKIDRIKSILKRIRMQWFPPSDKHPNDRSI